MILTCAKFRDKYPKRDRYHAGEALCDQLRFHPLPRALPAPKYHFQHWEDVHSHYHDSNTYTNSSELHIALTTQLTLTTQTDINNTN